MPKIVPPTKKITFLLLIIILLAIPTRTIYAQAANQSTDIICGSSSINTAIGCIPTGSPKAFATFLLRWIIGLGGLVAMIFTVYAGFLILTSAGNPKQVAAGKELLTAAISGLILLTLSPFLLRFIGVDVLGLPGF
jgi:beta-lactamase regulating signal transducer with metallopeptidase domain